MKFGLTCKTVVFGLAYLAVALLFIKFLSVGAIIAFFVVSVLLIVAACAVAMDNQELVERLFDKLDPD